MGSAASRGTCLTAFLHLRISCLLRAVSPAHLFREGMCMRRRRLAAGTFLALPVSRVEGSTGCVSIRSHWWISREHQIHDTLIRHYRSLLHITEEKRITPITPTLLSNHDQTLHLTKLPNLIECDHMEVS